MDHTALRDEAAIVHTTNCGRYVVCAPSNGISNVVCRSLGEAYDVLRVKQIDSALFAQRVAFDEMIGLPSGEDVSYTLLAVPSV